MTRLAEINLRDHAAAHSFFQVLVTHLRRRVAHTEAAMERQSRLAAIQPDTVGDTGLAPEDLTGVATYDPALPFFMQSGFGRHDR
ncbi:hypothetical protein [Tabrizicola sp.]|uniref:hypothetical protein n=1 Tax=Tabrizicola sp. TaxID=2005166 RepID=UPI0027350CB4|nr:hypothetical protein [Tabrizicola sp.]MDP3195788.1 hypothetical protein [Tabrizicola sp.]